MTKLFQTEHAGIEKPILLLFGNTNALIAHIIQELSDKTTIAFVSNSDQLAQKEAGKIFFIPKSEAYALKSVKETFSYSLILLESKDDKRYLLDIADKIDTDNTRTIICISARSLIDFTDVVAAFKKHKNTTLVIIGDVFGNIVGKEFSEASKIIHNGIRNKKVEITGNDLEPLFPISDQDILHAFQLLLFGNIHKKPCYLLFYEHPQTIISTVHLLKRVEPDLEVILSDGFKTTSGTPSQELIISQLQAKLSEPPLFLDRELLGFEKSVTSFLTKTPRSFSSIKEESKDYPSRKLRPFPTWKTDFFIIPLIFFVGLLFLHILLGIGLIFSFNHAYNALQNKDVSTFKTSITYSYVLQGTMDGQIRTFLPILPENYRSKYLAFVDSLEFLNTFKKDIEMFENLGEEIDKKESQNLLSNLNDLYFSYSLLTTEHSEIPKLPVSSYSSYLSAAQQFPYLAGYKEEKRYLILFQNNGELRPTGGFIGSLADVQIKNGSIKEFEIYDVYDIDGQLKAHVEPHYIVRRFLQPHLYLRDSNFSLDFERSASTSALLYKLSTGKNIDGVIGLNYEAIRQIVEATGPLRLDRYDKTLDASSLFDFIENSIDESFFPGSSEKKELLKTIHTALLLRITENKKNFYIVLSLLPKLIEEKNILFAVSTGSIQKAFSQNSMSATLVDIRAPEKTLIRDVFGFNEANIGVNKANRSIARRVEYDTYITTRKITSKATLELINTADNAKEYKAYIRLITPLKSTISSVVIDGIKQELVEAVVDFREYERKTFKPPVGLEVDRTDEQDKTIFGFVTTVGKTDSQKIEIEYTNGLKTPVGSSINYSLWAIKQPGTGEYPLSARVHYPRSLQADAESEKTSQTILFEGVARSDVKKSMKFIQTRY